MHKVYIWGTGYWGENCFQDILDGVEVSLSVLFRENR